MNALTLADLVTKRPVKIELVEWSGPVSLRYQWSTRVVIEREGERLTLRFEDRRAAEDGTPASVRVEEALPPAGYERLLADLLAANAGSLSHDFIGDEKRKRVGVSFNHIDITVGDGLRCRIDYLASDVARARFEKHRKVLEILRGARTYLH
ncbi:Hypothetical protein A7982_09957 [Minicystis rosea]|nr:Hypothetical protein A7982_09957 [Minicystis rosea]